MAHLRCSTANKNGSMFILSTEKNCSIFRPEKSPHGMKWRSYLSMKPLDRNIRQLNYRNDVGVKILFLIDFLEWNFSDYISIFNVEKIKNACHNHSFHHAKKCAAFYPVYFFYLIWIKQSLFYYSNLLRINKKSPASGAGLNQIFSSLQSYKARGNPAGAGCPF